MHSLCVTLSDDYSHYFVQVRSNAQHVRGWPGSGKEKQKKKEEKKYPHGAGMCMHGAGSALCSVCRRSRGLSRACTRVGRPCHGDWTSKGRRFMGEKQARDGARTPGPRPRPRAGLRPVHVYGYLPTSYLLIALIGVHTYVGTPALPGQGTRRVGDHAYVLRLPATAGLSTRHCMI